MDLRHTAGQVLDGFAEHRLLTYASAIAYQAIGALIPFALFALGLAGTLHLDGLWSHQLRPELAARTSTDVFVLLDRTVTQVLGQTQTLWVTFGLALVIWELGGAMRATMEALDDIYDTSRRRSRLDKYVTSSWLAAAVGALWLAAIFVVVGGRAVVGGPLGALAGYALAALVLMLATGLTLRIGPAERPPVRWVSVGSVVIVLGWLAVVGGYVFYATAIASYGSVFGSLAAVFVAIAAAYLSAVVLLTGVLVDAKARDEG